MHNVEVAHLLDGQHHCGVMWAMYRDHAKFGPIWLNGVFAANDKLRKALNAEKKNQQDSKGK